MLRTLRKWQSATAVLIILMITCIFETSIPVSASESEVIAAWDYTTAPTSYPVPATCGMLMSEATLKSYQSLAWPTYKLGGLSVSGWDGEPNVKYWLVSLSTKGYHNLSLSAKTSSSGTGPRDFKVIYSIDLGNTWKDVTDSSYAITNTSIDNYMPVLSLPEDTSNLDKLYIKFIITSKISSRAGRTIDGKAYPLSEQLASTGTSQINNIIISGERIIPVTGIGINITKKNINIGETFQLFPEIMPSNATNKNLLWETSNSSVVTVVGEGIVIAVDDGTAVITATTIDGSFHAKCTVIVTVPVKGIELDKSQAEMSVNETISLAASIVPENATNKGVLWTSSKPEIATVDENGRVTAVGGGTAVITARTVDGGLEASCTVNVIVPVTGVQFENQYYTVKPGTTHPLIASITPNNATNKKIIWTSSDPEIASVDECGNVTGKSIGITRIKATTEDGNFKAECLVTVAEVPVTGIRINKDTITIEEGKLEMLTAHLLHGNVSVKDLSWVSSNEAIIKVGQKKQNGKTVEIIGVYHGEAIITVTTRDGGYYATCKVIVIPSKKDKK